MTRDEMLAFIKENPYIHIRHSLFENYEYIYSGSDGIIYDEYGYIFENWETIGRCDGLRIRVGGLWETGWSVTDTF